MRDKRAELVGKLPKPTELPAEGVFPYQIEAVPVLQRALAVNPRDGHAALYLGHLMFALGRHDQARQYWLRGGSASPTVALRALAMATLKVDKNTTGAIRLLTEAHGKDPRDAIVARDLARAILGQAEKEENAQQAKEFRQRARTVLTNAYEAGRIRSDFVTLLGRAQNRLGDYEATARMLDTVRVTVWEGAREVHDLFEDAHLALGKGHLEAGRNAEALREFDRALEYPENLATGKLENTREAHIHYLRGNALAALGRQTEAVTAWKRAADEPESKDQKIKEARQKAIEALKKAGK